MVPALDDARLDVLNRLGILDTDAEASFDAITQEMARILSTPMAAISLIDRHRQWFKSSIGLDVTETDREVAFCDYTIRGTTPLIVSDSLNDHRFRLNPLVHDGPRIRFYLGMPIMFGDVCIGSLCALDRIPRTVTPNQLEAVASLADSLGLQLTRWAEVTLARIADRRSPVFAS